jgi:hypothetical protein
VPHFEALSNNLILANVKEFCGLRSKRFAFLVAPLKRHDNSPLQFWDPTINQKMR